MPKVADYRSAALGFAVAVAYWPGMLSPAYVPRWAAIAIGLPLLLNLDPRAVPPTVRGIFCFVFALGALATAFVSPDPYGGYLELFYAALLGLALVAGANLEKLDDLMTGLCAGLACSSALVLWQVFTKSSPVPQGMSPGGLFYSPEAMAEFSALIAVWALLRLRWWMAAVAVIPLAFCQSRIALLMVCAGLAFAFWPKNWALRSLYLGVILLAGIAAAIFLKGASTDHRIVLWATTLMSWSIMGHGFGWFQASYPFEVFAHSDALQIVAEAGIGAFALAAIPVMALRTRQGTNADRATFFAGCIACVVSFPLHFPASGFLIAVLAGHLVADRSRLCVGGRVGKHHDGGRDSRAIASGDGDYYRLRERGGTVSVRSVCETAARLRAGKNQFHPGKA